MEHSIVFPLPFSLHMGFVIFSVVMLILCYMKRKYLYEIYMLIGVLSTMFIYICGEKPYFYILGLEELIVMALTIADMTKVSRANAAREKAAAEAAEAAKAAAEAAKAEEEAAEDISGDGGETE